MDIPGRRCLVTLTEPSLIRFRRITVTYFFFLDFFLASGFSSLLIMAAHVLEEALAVAAELAGLCYLMRDPVTLLRGSSSFYLVYTIALPLRLKGDPLA